MGAIEKEKEKKRTDGIMQILRAICLKSDGLIFFHITSQPTTLNILRQYMLHVVFLLPAPSSNGALDGTTEPVRDPFPFSHKPNTLDRDSIVAPAGWDS
ncbi:hypothetical protein EI94DRAFT_79455 [Lactarius quietus]|nr:hypothetical protein EI94DRAFT_79455 [Lactarius quietus]